MTLARLNPSRVESYREATRDGQYETRVVGSHRHVITAASGSLCLDCTIVGPASQLDNHECDADSVRLAAFE
jgi:hypothetical protein